MAIDCTYSQNTKKLELDSKNNFQPTVEYDFADKTLTFLEKRKIEEFTLKFLENFDKNEGSSMSKFQEKLIQQINNLREHQ